MQLNRPLAFAPLAAAGVALRYLLPVTREPMISVLPPTTLANVVGSFIAGVLAAYSASDTGRRFADAAGVTVAALCGCLTSFSDFIVHASAALVGVDGDRYDLWLSLARLAVPLALFLYAFRVGRAAGAAVRI